MANEVRLEVYTIKIRQERNKEYLPLDDFFDKNDFLVFFQDYISSFDKELNIDEERKKSLKIDSKKLQLSTEKRMISGIIESGGYGYESEIYNVITSAKQYTKTINDADIKPFYFLIYLPSNCSIGYVILQRFGIYGINSVLREHLKKFFCSKYNSMQLDFNQFISDKLAKTFIEEGNIKEFTLTRYNLPTDVVDKLGMQGYQEAIKSIEIKITAKQMKSFGNNKIEKFVKDKNAIMFDLKELTSLGFDGNHKSQVKIEHKGNTRTIDLSDTANIRPYYDIDKDVIKNKSGHPDFDSINEIAKKLILELTEN
ncbi:MAG: hypothetical protein A2X02_05415 [Bacteroidetes bacterium GWF2_29_10]|nr:MAG: hypothetical protein A2X02_05415 [Bacteroidetes bacterium GWF2_29_10]